jgi:hypothetical protein
VLTRRRTGLVFASMLACMALAIPAAGAAPRTPAPPASAKANAMPRPAAKAPPQTFPDAVAAIGTTKFQDAYGGQETTPSGRLVIYVVAAHGASLVSAIHSEAAHSAGSEYSVAYVPHSWAQLNALTTTIAQQEPRWRAAGIQLARWGPDAASSKVTIDLRAYTATAAGELLHNYGSEWVSVSHESLNLNVVFEDRYYDYAPFYGGDAIFPNASNPQVYCTDAFTMLGNNNPSNHWLLTAGHCGIQHPWYTNFYSKYSFASTSTDYFHGFGGSTATDVQTMGPVNAWGDVWGNSTTIYYPYTTFQPGNGQLITFDGARTGAVFGATVTASGPFCLTVQGIDDCNLGQAQSSNVICQPGDSGGQSSSARAMTTT